MREESACWGRGRLVAVAVICGLGFILTGPLWAQARSGQDAPPVKQLREVHERRVFLMAAPRRFGPQVATLRYKTPVTVLEEVEGGEWLRVRAGADEGFLPATALVEAGVELRAGAAQAPAQPEVQRVQLAARGFRTGGAAGPAPPAEPLDFERVDLMELTLPSPTQVQAAAAAGGLRLVPLPPAAQGTP